MEAALQADFASAETMTNPLRTRLSVVRSEKEFSWLDHGGSVQSNQFDGKPEAETPQLVYPDLPKRFRHLICTY